MKYLLFIFVLLFSVAEVYGGFIPAPKDSVKALKLTKGRPFKSGVVFIDGKYLPPPYVVERYGNVIRINKIQASNPVIDWSEFIRTQDGVVVTKIEESVAVPEPVVAEPEPPEPEPAVEDDDPLAELFEDEPVKKPVKPVKSVKKPVTPKPSPKPRTVTKVTMDGDFVMNDSAKMLVNKINAVRTEIDASLRRGSFICFGSAYSRVLGDRETAERILEKVPTIMQKCTDVESFSSAMRKAGFVYFPSRLIEDMYEHRIDYPLLQNSWKKCREEKSFNAMLENAGVSTH